MPDTVSEMKILGIETSCDETAAAVVENGRLVLSNVIASQIDIHAAYGGVVPEVAARSHIEVILPVIQEALDKAKTDWNKIDAIATTGGPGLSGSLLIGTLAARTLAIIKDKPLYGINHVLGHVYANFIDWSQLPKASRIGASAAWQEPEFPMLALIVSGGHTQLVLFEDHFKYQLLGQTQDDAVGEAFDKVAKIIGLPYPGGPSIQEAAKHGDAKAYNFPKAKMQNPYDFSFSGLKTAVLRQTQKICGKDYTFPSVKLAPLLNGQQVNDIAASFQRVAVETLVDKTTKAYSQFSPKTVVIAGGVAANSQLRKVLAERLPVGINYAPLNLCTDNAVMIAALGFYQSLHQNSDSPYKFSINPSLAI